MGQDLLRGLQQIEEVYVNGDVTVEREEDLPQLIDILTQLRREDVIQNNALCGNVVRAVTMNGPISSGPLRSRLNSNSSFIPGSSGRP